MDGRVVGVSRSPDHTFSKVPVDRIELVAGLGVRGDAHMGTTIRHRARVAKDPDQPNLRQVHLIASELFLELREVGYSVSSGQLGENITTEGVDLIRLPVGTRLHLGVTAIVEVTGLRDPCRQIDRLQPGLMAALLEHDAEGRLVRKGGIMGIVSAAGPVCPGDSISVVLPQTPHRPLQPV